MSKIPQGRENCWIISSLDDVYSLPKFTILGADFETSSGDKDKSSTNPFHTCTPLGFAFVGDNDYRAFYMPWFLPGDPEGEPSGAKAFAYLLQNCFVWYNHNIKYDAHVANLAGVAIPEDVELHCTLTLAHIIDADRSFKGGYTLDALAKAYLPKTYRKKKASLTPYLKYTAISETGRRTSKVSKDYGDVPQNVMAVYAAADAVVNRALYWRLLDLVQPGTGEVLDNEFKLTRVLFDMERRGLKIDLKEVKIAELTCLRRMLNIEAELGERLGYPLNPKSPDDVYDLICVRFGQPVKQRTEKGGPSFGKVALKAYVLDPETPRELLPLIKLIQAYRKESQNRSLFYEPWQEQHVNGVLHGTYTQNVRSSRMACKEPNEQQINKDAKAPVVPRPGKVFILFDQAQIEYRILVHYIRDQKCLAAYEQDPDTDYHQYKADDCGITRRSAKTANFAMSFGQGQRAAVDMLAVMLREEDENITASEAKSKARKIRERHMRSLPTLQPTKDKAARLATERGYVRSIGGRHLHLPGPKHNFWRDTEGKLINRTHIALTGRVVQGSAAEVQKFHAVRIQPLLKKLGVDLLALVHDSFLMECDDDSDDVILGKAAKIREALEVNPFDMSVPLRAEGGISRISWANCDQDGELIEIDGVSKWCGEVSREQLDAFC